MRRETVKSLLKEIPLMLDDYCLTISPISNWFYCSYICWDSYSFSEIYETKICKTIQWALLEIKKPLIAGWLLTTKQKENA